MRGMGFRTKAPEDEKAEPEVTVHKTDIDRQNYVDRKHVLFGRLGMERVSEIEAKVRDAYDRTGFGKF